VGDVRPDNALRDGAPFERPQRAGGLTRIGGVPAYAVDPLVRRAPALQQTPDAQDGARVYIAAADAERLGLVGAERATVRQGEQRAELPLSVYDGVPEGCVWVPAGIEATAGLGPSFGPVVLEKI
jgi:NADH-quinone oxidoreductase subunit G